MTQFILAILSFVLIIEICLRFYWFRLLPLRIRLAYSLFLLSHKKMEENYVIAQRMDRGRFRSEKELFNHYSKISGKPVDEIEKKFGREKGWRAIFGRSYHSGGHGVIEQVLSMHLGLIPKSNQTLATMEVDVEGHRKSGYPIERENGVQKTCVLLGGSVTLGLGATSDAATIPGRLQYHLNQWGGGSCKFRVLNYGMMGFSSFQELLSLLQSDIKPDYVISLSGWNEVDQNIDQGFSKVSTLAQTCNVRYGVSPYYLILSNFFKNLLFIQVARRFVESFIVYRSEGNCVTSIAKRWDNGESVDNIYPLL